MVTKALLVRLEIKPGKDEEAEQVLVVHVEAEVAGDRIEMGTVDEEAQPLLGIKMHVVIFRSNESEHRRGMRNRHPFVSLGARL